MRRKDREITDETKIIEIINNCNCCRLGFNDNGKVYIVPLNFGFERINGQYTFFFHSAKEGRKIDLIEKEQYAGFEMDTNYKLNEAKEPCDYSARFQSIIGTGKLTFIEENDDKTYALQRIMYHNTGRDNWRFPSVMLNRVTVFKLVVEELSCKEHK